MDVANETKLVERELTIDARPETVWRVLVLPELATRWMGQRADFDLRHGGVYRVEVIPGHVARGEFVEIDAPHRLSFTWGWESSAAVPPGSTLVSFELVPRGASTILRFSHRGLPNDEALASHAHGWEHYLERLVRFASDDDPGRDPWVDGVPA